MSKPRPSTTSIRCPNCGSRNFLLIEVSDAMAIWAIRDGKTDRSDAVLEPGDPLYLRAECPCGHNWRLRSKTLGDVLIEDEAFAL